MYKSLIPSLLFLSLSSCAVVDDLTTGNWTKWGCEKDAQKTFNYSEAQASAYCKDSRAATQKSWAKANNVPENHSWSKDALKVITPIVAAVAVSPNKAVAVENTRLALASSGNAGATNSASSSKLPQPDAAINEAADPKCSMVKIDLRSRSSSLGMPGYGGATRGEPLRMNYSSINFTKRKEKALSDLANLQKGDYPWLQLERESLKQTLESLDCILKYRDALNIPQQGFQATEGDVLPRTLTSKIRGLDPKCFMNSSGTDYCNRLIDYGVEAVDSCHYNKIFSGGTYKYPNIDFLNLRNSAAPSGSISYGVHHVFFYESTLKYLYDFRGKLLNRNDPVINLIYQNSDLYKNRLGYVKENLDAIIKTYECHKELKYPFAKENVVVLHRYEHRHVAYNGVVGTKDSLLMLSPSQTPNCKNGQYQEKNYSVCRN